MTDQQIATDSEQGQRLIAMGQMAASLAHEIRNPLGSMELFCSLLKKDLAEQPEALNLAEQIHAGIRRLNHIITNCLQFSRDLKPKYKELTDSAAFIREVVGFIKPQAEAAEITIRLEESSEAPAWVDAHQLQQALVNILLNAVEAFQTQQADGERLIEIKSTVSSDGQWCLTISDNGIGMSEEDASHVFDPFYSTKERGTGLGLSVVYSIINAHNGSISIASRPGKGTIVSVELPGASQKGAV